MRKQSEPQARLEHSLTGRERRPKIVQVKRFGKKRLSKRASAPRSRKSADPVNDKLLREQLVKLLDGSEAHAGWRTALADMPHDLQGRKPDGAQHTTWQLLEHMRIAQWDILEFSRNPKHVSPQFPEGYWPATEAPPDAAAWEKSAESFGSDLAEMKKLVRDSKTNLFEPIAHGEGQTILREALLVADHNAYHLGQIVLIRKILRSWPE